MLDAVSQENMSLSKTDDLATRVRLTTACTRFIHTQDQAEEGEGFAEGEAAIADEEIGEGDDEETSGHEKGRRKDMYKIRSLLLQVQLI